MFTKLFSDIRILIFSYLTDKELVMLDSSLCCKDRNLILNEYKYIENIDTTDEYIDYFVSKNVKIFKITIKKLDCLYKLDNIKTQYLYVDLDYGSFKYKNFIKYD